MKFMETYFVEILANLVAKLATHIFENPATLKLTFGDE